MPDSPGKVGVRTKRIVNDTNTRMKIKTTQIQKRLSDHIFGNVELSSTQVRAAEILLNKTLPNLQSLEVDQTTNEKRPLISDKPMDKDEYKAKYSVATPGRPAEKLN